MAKLHADIDTLQQVRAVLADAAERGLDAAEALDRAGLLHYGAREKKIRAEAVGRASDAVDVITVDQVAKELQERQPSSPGEMKRQIAYYLQLVARRMAQT